LHERVLSSVDHGCVETRLRRPLLHERVLSSVDHGCVETNRQASDYMRQHWQAEENREVEHEANTIARDILNQEINAVKNEVAILRGELRDKKYSEDEPDKLPELKPGEFYIVKDPEKKRAIRFMFSGK
jgi:flagellar hook protein FlgE